MERDILGYKCRKCGHVQYPYRSRCRACRHVEWNGLDIVFDTVPLAKTGKLLTFTHLYALPGDFERINLSLGIVEVEGGNRITGQLKINDPQMGMKVRGKVEIVRRQGYDKYWGMVFYADET
jgi:uncharacterized OB-fold protein